MTDDRAPESLRDKVRSAATAMLADGKLPTGRAVREKVGTGSMQTIYRELEAWAQELGATQSVPKAPDTLQQLLNTLWQQAVTEADARHVQALEERDGMIAELQGALSRLQATLAQDHAAHAARSQELEQQLQEARDQVRRLTVVASEQEEAAAVLAREAAALRDQLVEAQRAGEAARILHLADAADAQERYAALEGRLQAELAALRLAGEQALEAAEVAHQREMAQAQHRVEESAQAVAYLRGEVAAEQQRLEQVARENTGLQVELAAARSTISSLTERAALLEDNMVLLRRLLEQHEAMERAVREAGAEAKKTDSPK